MKDQKVLLEQFVKLFGKKSIPDYKEVKDKAPDLFSAIMLKYGGYLAFLRRHKLPLPPLSKKRKAFQKFSSECSKRYFKRGEWSSLEKIVNEILIELGLEPGLNFIHNYKHPGMKGRPYKFDFYLPKGNVRISVKGLFHNFEFNKIRDKEKNKWLEENYKVTTVEIDSSEFKDLSKLKERLRTLLCLDGE